MEHAGRSSGDPQKVLERMIVELEPGLRERARARGLARYADDAYSALWPELSRAIDADASWTRGDDGVSERRIESWIRLRFTSRLLDAYRRDDDETLVDLRADANGAERFMADHVDGDYGSSVEREVIGGARGEITGAVQRELARMPAAMRQAVEAHLDDRSYQEISELLGVSSHNARKLVSRGLRRLRSTLERKGLR